MDTEVRRLNKNNIEEIIPLRIALQKFDYDNNLEIDEKLLENRTREFLNENLDKDVYMFGLYENNILVSICGLTIFKYFPQANDLSCTVGYITSVYTKEECRRRGYQKRVFSACLELGEKLGIKRFKLSTKNPNAMKMYEQFGFINDPNAKKMRK